MPNPTTLLCFVVEATNSSYSFFYSILQDLPADARKEKEVLLEGFERMRKQQELVERERKFAKIYHKVKFFGRDLYFI